jgi:hypothetical protein
LFCFVLFCCRLPSALFAWLERSSAFYLDPTTGESTTSITTSVTDQPLAFAGRGLAPLVGKAAEVTLTVTGGANVYTIGFG